MYALTGANGHLGRLVLQHLLALMPTQQIIATTRNPQLLTDFATQGVLVRRADFTDHETVLQNMTLEHLLAADLTFRSDRRIQSKGDLLLIICQQFAVFAMLV